MSQCLHCKNYKPIWINNSGTMLSRTTGTCDAGIKEFHDYVNPSFGCIKFEEKPKEIPVNAYLSGYHIYLYRVEAPQLTNYQINTIREMVGVRHFARMDSCPGHLIDDKPPTRTYEVIIQSSLVTGHLARKNAEKIMERIVDYIKQCS